MKESFDVLKETSSALRGMYISMTFEFYLKLILKSYGIYLLKLATLVYNLDCNVSWIYKQRLASNISYSP